MGALIDAASRPYLAAGRGAYHFARGKLRHDPVFTTLLRAGCIPHRARVLDLGCGQALFASLLLAARARFESGLWPAGWPSPPSALQLHGIELERRAAQRAQITLGHRATIDTADLRDWALPDADVVLMIDVLHYLERDTQVSLLERVAQSLRGGGLFVLRVADMSAGWRFHFGKAADLVGSLVTARAMSKQHHRCMNGWLHLLANLGFSARVESNAEARSFANVLVWAQAPAIRQA
jgi:SAM-dependent methyltransferase